MVRSILVAMVIVAGPLAHADTSTSANRIQTSDEYCRDRLARAREELLAGNFDPARETSQALQVHTSSDGALELSLHVQVASDSLHEHYSLNIDPTPERGSTAWARRRRAICCDDHAEAEDHVTEVVWKRRNNGLVATVSTVTGRYAERPRWVALFTPIAKRVADDCLTRQRAR